MTIHYYIRDAAGAMVEVTRVRALTEDDSLNAEEGSVGVFRFAIDDPDGTTRVGGHRRCYVIEDEVIGDDQRIADGFTQERVISRGDLAEGLGTGGRVITVDVADLNTILSRRVMTGDDANRPAETDVSRMQWAVLTNEGSFIGDSRYLSEANPVMMNAADYRGQMLSSILEDCAEASGKNYFVTHFGNPATLSWAYFTPGEAIWSSTARLTNIGADVDDVTTFVVSTAELTQSPMRVFSGIYGTGDGIIDYRQRAATVTNFARRDTVMSFPNVKSAAKLTARVNRMLADLASEEYRVAITFYMRPADVNRVRPGMRVQAKFSHLPELGSGYVWLRMLSRQVTQDVDETGFAFYRISGVFSAEALKRSFVFSVTADTIDGGNSLGRSSEMLSPSDIEIGDVWRFSITYVNSNEGSYAQRAGFKLLGAETGGPAAFLPGAAADGDNLSVSTRDLAPNSEAAGATLTSEPFDWTVTSGTISNFTTPHPWWVRGAHSPSTPVVPGETATIVMTLVGGPRA